MHGDVGGSIHKRSDSRVVLSEGRLGHQAELFYTFFDPHVLKAII